MNRTIVLAVALLMVSACSQSGPGRAAATIEPRSGSQVTGSATFSEKDGKLEIVVTGSDLPAGPHGVHLHESGDCSAANAASVGDRFQPSEHAGDLGNIEVGEDGTGKLTTSSDALTIAGEENGVVGRAVVISVLPYDPAADPSKTFSIIGCGVIEKVS